MRNEKLIGLAALFLVFANMASCDGVASKVAESRNYDSLFLGISLGMDKKAFYDHCWELNKQKVFTHGPQNREVEYVLKDELEHPVYMRFYPTFYKEKVAEMPVLFTYESWAPWNKEFGSDSLLVKMADVFRKWYGDDFKMMDHPNMGTLYYKIDGKRRINLFIRDDQFVQAVFSDLKLLQEQEESGEEEATYDKNDQDEQ